MPDDPALVSVQLAEKPLSALVGAGRSADLPPSLDYTTIMDEIPDQGPTSSCVGQAFATALYLIASIADTPIPRPSAKLIYDYARAEDQPYVRLVDLGSRPTAAIRCLSDQGMVAESEWPIVYMPDGSSNINQRPYLDVYQDALGFKVGDYYRISSGAGASLGIRHALARGFCPVFAMPVDEAYEYNAGSLYEGRRGASLGGHMQAIGGYGDGFLRIVSSWGAAHGERGVVKIADDYIDSGEATDIIVVTMVPRLSAPAPERTSDR